MSFLWIKRRSGRSHVWVLSYLYEIGGRSSLHMLGFLVPSALLLCAGVRGRCPSQVAIQRHETQAVPEPVYTRGNPRAVTPRCEPFTRGFGILAGERR